MPSESNGSLLIRQILLESLKTHRGCARRFAKWLRLNRITLAIGSARLRFVRFQYNRSFSREACTFHQMTSPMHGILHKTTPVRAVVSQLTRLGSSAHNYVMCVCSCNVDWREDNALHCGNHAVIHHLVNVSCCTHRVVRTVHGTICATTSSHPDDS